MTLAHLDRQLLAARRATEAPDLPDRAWSRLATSIYDEVAPLDERAVNELRLSMLVPPERWVEELAVFQSWTTIAHLNEGDPAIVRAHVMTELYISFVWLWDSLMKPAAAALSTQSCLARLERFLGSGRRGTLRNAVARGRWAPMPDSGGVECWAELTYGYQRVEIGRADLEAWQMLSRGAAIAVLLALTE